MTEPNEAESVPEEVAEASELIPEAETVEVVSKFDWSPLQSTDTIVAHGEELLREIYDKIPGLQYHRNKTHQAHELGRGKGIFQIYITKKGATLQVAETDEGKKADRYVKFKLPVTKKDSAKIIRMARDYVKARGWNAQ